MEEEEKEGGSSTVTTQFTHTVLFLERHSSYRGSSDSTHSVYTVRGEAHHAQERRREEKRKRREERLKERERRPYIQWLKGKESTVLLHYLVPTLLRSSKEKEESQFRKKEKERRNEKRKRNKIYLLP